MTMQVAQLRSRLEAAEVGQAQNGSSAGSEQQQILALKSTIADLEKVGCMTCSAFKASDVCLAAR